ncbi:MAG TPA: ATP-binding cassette domain-containing protein [Solirubrobacteraceae bacterium]|jgi:branched-chain amino acid transport system permease protein|nr:ATP-binding cassette domain-containing protein [Solirubrobacteraceae bacterium]
MAASQSQPRLSAASLASLPSWSVPLGGVVLIALLPELGLSLPDQRQVILIAILTLLVSGLNLSLGYAGQLALGQPAIYAVGAYVSGYLGAHGHTNILLQLAAAMAACLLIGVITGVPGLRLGSWSLAMVSFGLILLVPDVTAMLGSQTGGALGLSGIETPTIFGAQISAHGLYVIAVVATGLWLGFLRNTIRSRFGPEFVMIRETPILAASLGTPIYRHKVLAYALGSVPAGVAGCLYANLQQFVSPETFDLTLAIAILAASILGGRRSIYGAIAGAVILQLGPLEATSFQSYSTVAYGAFIILGSLVLPQGLAGIADWLGERASRSVGPRAERAPSAARPSADAAAGYTTGDDRQAPASLEIVGVSKSFGGALALDDVSVSFKAGEITALIGPNGSGKTTLLNVISGFYLPNGGQVSMEGKALPLGRSESVARAGVARTFQTAQIPSGLSVLDTVRTGAYMNYRCSLVSTVVRSPRFRRNRRAAALAAEEALALVELTVPDAEDASSLPLGTRRMVEVARAAAARPKVLLLDEAASGLDGLELERLGDILRKLSAAGITVVIVEHNLEFVFSLVDRVCVLSRGRVVFSGTPADAAEDPIVRAEYLGSIEAPVQVNTADSARGQEATANAD